MLSTLNKGEKRWRSKQLFWLSLHTAIHLFLVILSHCSTSPVASLTALVSQLMLFTIFLRAKSLADDVASASSVVRKASRVLGTHARVDGSQKLLLQMQVLVDAGHRRLSCTGRSALKISWIRAIVSWTMFLGRFLGQETVLSQCFLDGFLSKKQWFLGRIQETMVSWTQNNRRRRT